MLRSVAAVRRAWARPAAAEGEAEGADAEDARPAAEQDEVLLIPEPDHVSDPRTEMVHPGDAATDGSGMAGAGWLECLAVGTPLQDLPACHHGNTQGHHPGGMRLGLGMSFDLSVCQGGGRLCRLRRLVLEGLYVYQRGRCCRHCAWVSEHGCEIQLGPMGFI